jgi:hypothetical protein
MQFFKKTNKQNTFYQKDKSLTELANLFETDKGTAEKSTLSWGKDWPEHVCMGYTKTYEKYMIPYREKPIKLFEIGICDKRFPYASPKMWLSYFNNIDLYCVDNFWGTYLKDRVDEVNILNNWGVNFIYADQGNFCDWNELKQVCPNDFDFFIEDGSHWPNHMVISLWQAIDIMKPGSYYFMEDIQNPVYSRGKFRYDNSLLMDELLMTKHSGTFKTCFLNDQQNKEIDESFELVELVLDSQNVNYLAVFKKK